MHTMPTLRFADPETARRYPLAVSGPAAWQAERGTWRLTVPLPEVGPGTILVPSLALAATHPAPDVPGRAATPRHRWALSAQGETWPLQEVPASAPVPPARPGAVSSHIDCYHVHRTLRDSSLILTVTSEEPPGRHLVSVSVRPLTLTDAEPPGRAARLDHVPPPRSQLTAPEAIANRICSPTCVSMVLDLWQRRHDWLSLTQECYDVQSRMYGVWPLALAAAARRGCLGAVEVFRSWEEPLSVLDAGIPLVTSIRFAPGELPGAPLEETSGHLVVVHGATGEAVQVCDPAAPPGEVQREYPAKAFSRAWLRHRGAAYILPP